MTTFRPEPTQVRLIAAGFTATQTTNTIGGETLPANPEIQTVEDYIDSLANSRISAHRDVYVQAVNGLLKSQNDFPGAHFPQTHGSIPNVA